MAGSIWCRDRRERGDRDGNSLMMFSGSAMMAEWSVHVSQKERENVAYDSITVGSPLTYEPKAY